MITSGGLGLDNCEKSKCGSLGKKIERTLF